MIYEFTFHASRFTITIGYSVFPVSLAPSRDERHEDAEPPGLDRRLRRAVELAVPVQVDVLQPIVGRAVRRVGVEEAVGRAVGAPAPLPWDDRRRDQHGIGAPGRAAAVQAESVVVLLGDGAPEDHHAARP